MCSIEKIRPRELYMRIGADEYWEINEEDGCFEPQFTRSSAVPELPWHTSEAIDDFTDDDNWNPFSIEIALETDIKEAARQVWNAGGDVFLTYPEAGLSEPTSVLVDGMSVVDLPEYGYSILRIFFQVYGGFEPV